MNLFCSCPRFFHHHSNNPLLQSLVNTSLAASSREVGYSTMRLKRLDNIAHSGHRNTKVSGDGHVALRLSMLGYNLLSDLLRQFSVFFPFVNTQCGSCSDTKQQNEGVAPFKLVG